MHFILDVLHGTQAAKALVLNALVAIEHPMPTLATPDIGQSTSSRPSEEASALDTNDSLSLGRFDINSSMDFCIILRIKPQQSPSHIGVARGCFAWGSDCMPFIEGNLKKEIPQEHFLILYCDSSNSRVT